MMHPSPQHTLGGRSQSVLIVDDDEYVLGTLEAALRGLRVRLLTARTAAEGEALALQHRPRTFGWPPRWREYGSSS